MYSKIPKQRVKLRLVVESEELLEGLGDWVSFKVESASRWTRGQAKL